MFNTIICHIGICLQSYQIGVGQDEPANPDGNDMFNSDSEDDSDNEDDSGHCDKPTIVTVNADKENRVTPKNPSHHHATRKRGKR